MRKILTALLGSAICASAAHVQFDMTDFVAGGISRRVIWIKPASMPMTNATDIITGDAIRRYTDTSGQCIVSNMAGNSIYACLIYGPETNTIFNLNIPITNALINAKDFLTDTPSSPSSVTGYTIAQANALFVLRNSGWSSNQFLTNAFFMGSTNVFRHTNSAVAGYVLYTDGTNAYWAPAPAGGPGGSGITNQGINLGGEIPVYAGMAAGNTNLQFSTLSSNQFASNTSVLSIKSGAMLSNLFVYGSNRLSGQIVLPDETPGAAYFDSELQLKGLVSVSQEELGWLDSVTNNIQTQLNSKLTDVNFSSVLFVATNGNNATATRGLLTKPSATVSNAIHYSTNGDTIVVLPGDYREYIAVAPNYGNSLWIRNKTNFSIIGIGRPRIISTNASGTPGRGDLFIISGGRNILIDGIDMVGATNRPGDPGATLARAITFYSPSNNYIKIQNCGFYNWSRFGVAEADAESFRNNYLEILDNYFFNCGSSNLTGVGDGAAIVLQSSHSKAARNIIENCFRGIEIFTIPTVPIHTIDVIGNQIKGCWGEGIIAFNARDGSFLSGIRIAHNTIYGTNSWGSPLVAANNCGIFVNNAQHIDISHNTIRGYPELGVQRSYSALHVNAGTNNCRNYNISCNIIEGIANSPGVTIYSGVRNGTNYAPLSGVNFTGNTLHNIDYTGMDVNANDVLIAFNTFQNVSTNSGDTHSGIWLRNTDWGRPPGASNVIILNNIISDVLPATTSEAIELDPTNYNVFISGNFVGPGITPFLDNGMEATNIRYIIATNEWQAMEIKGYGGGADQLLILDSADNRIKRIAASSLPVAGGGEKNVGTNIGTGVGVYLSNATEVLRFRSLSDSQFAVSANNSNVAVKSGATFTNVTLPSETASRLLTLDSGNIIKPGTATDTEAGYLSGVTSAIQTQLNNKQPLDADLTQLAGLSSVGLSARTSGSPETWALRSIASGSSKITIANGSGQVGNPTIDAVETNFTLNNLSGILDETKIDADIARDSEIVPAGADTHVQYNSSGAFAGEAGFEYVETTKLLIVPHLLATENATIEGTLDVGTVGTAAMLGFYDEDTNVLDLVVTNDLVANMRLQLPTVVEAGVIISTESSTNMFMEALTNGSEGQVLKIAGGVPAWGTDAGGGSNLWVQINGTNVGQQPRLNLVEGANITLTGVSEGLSNSITIASAGGAGGPTTSNNIPSVAYLTFETTNIHFDADVATVFYYTNTANSKYYMTNGSDGQTVTLRITQDATGSRSAIMGDQAGGDETNMVRFGTDITDITLTTNALKTDYIRLQYYKAAEYWDVIGFVRGY